MKKVLIYFPESKLAPTGGPAGYLYNLKNGLDAMKAKSDLDIEITFYNALPNRFEDNIKLKSKVPNRILELRRALNDVCFLKKRFPIDPKLKEYDIIHFHWTEEMYLNRDTLKDYKGKIILTSHSPCVMYKEKIGRLNPSDYRLLKCKVDRLEEMDIYAFERADYIIFPCEEAEEPYYHTWDKYESIRKKEKYRYIPTGIVGCHAKVARDEYREKWNIPETAFVVSYVGRHNEIKGYGDLKKIGSQMLKDRNVYFLVAGQEEPMQGLEDDHWIEVGWTDDPHSLIAASDIFVLPNHETYFDLILLEVLSLGIPVVLSNTGGNKYFKMFKQAGMRFFDTLSQAEEYIQEFQEMSKDEYITVGTSLKELFAKEFSVVEFAKRYVEMISKIANNMDE